MHTVKSENTKICNLPSLRRVCQGGQFEICNSRKNGFTLIEVLLSLVLLTIVLGVVYSSFFTVQRAIERFDGISLKYHEARTILDIIRREIDGAILKKSQLPDSDVNQTAFVIEDRDTFGKPTSRLRLASFSFKGSGLKTISYYVQETNENLVLIKEESYPFMLSAKKNRADASPGKEYALEMIEGIEGFTIETLFNDKWIKTWDSKETGTLPEAVRFSIEFDDNGKKVKLTEYARPKIGRQL